VGMWRRAIGGRLLQERACEQQRPAFQQGLPCVRADSGHHADVRSGAAAEALETGGLIHSVPGGPATGAHGQVAAVRACTVAAPGAGNAMLCGGDADVVRQSCLPRPFGSQFIPIWSQTRGIRAFACLRKAVVAQTRLAAVRPNVHATGGGCAPGIAEGSWGSPGRPGCRTLIAFGAHRRCHGHGTAGRSPSCRRATGQVELLSRTEWRGMASQLGKPAATQDCRQAM
jgi:hypothetical protein